MEQKSQNCSVLILTLKKKNGFYNIGISKRNDSAASGLRNEFKIPWNKKKLAGIHLFKVESVVCFNLHEDDETTTTIDINDDNDDNDIDDNGNGTKSYRDFSWEPDLDVLESVILAPLANPPPPPLFSSSSPSLSLSLSRKVNSFVCRLIQ